MSFLVLLKEEDLLISLIGLFLGQDTGVSEDELITIVESTYLLSCFSFIIIYTENL